MCLWVGTPKIWKIFASLEFSKVVSPMLTEPIKKDVLHFWVWCLRWITEQGAGFTLPRMHPNLSPSYPRWSFLLLLFYSLPFGQVIYKCGSNNSHAGDLGNLKVIHLQLTFPVYNLTLFSCVSYIIDISHVSFVDSGGATGLCKNWHHWQESYPRGRRSKAS